MLTEFNNNEQFDTISYLITHIVFRWFAKDEARFDFDDLSGGSEHPTEILLRSSVFGDAELLPVSATGIFLAHCFFPSI